MFLTTIYRCRATIRKYLLPVVPKKKKLEDEILRVLNRLLDTSNTSTVTIDHVLRKLKWRVSRRTVFRVFGKHGIRFRTLPKKGILYQRSVEKRAIWARKYRPKKLGYWKTKVFLDNKYFPCFFNARGKLFCTRGLRKGIFRKRGRDAKLFSYRNCRNSGQKFNTGHSMICCSLAISWRGIEYLRLNFGKWNSHKACLLYAQLGKKLPAQSVLVEDNDPAGYSSRAGVLAKQRNGLVAIKLPPHTPECQPLDYSIFSYINRQVALSNLRCLDVKESPKQYRERLRRIILRTPLQIIRNAISDLPKRIDTLARLNGDIFFD